MRPSDTDMVARRRRGLWLGASGLVLLFVPAVVLILLPGGFGAFAIVAMVAGIVLLVAGFVTLPGSLRNLMEPKR